MSPFGSLFTLEPQRYGRIPDACLRYGWSKSAIYRLAARELIVLRKVGRGTYVDFASCDRFMASLPVAAIKPPRDPDAVAAGAMAPVSQSPSGASSQPRRGRRVAA